MLHEVDSRITFEVSCDHPEHDGLTHQFEAYGHGTVSAATPLAAAELFFRTIFNRLAVLPGLTGTLTAPHLIIYSGTGKGKSALPVELETLRFNVKYRSTAVRLQVFFLDYAYVRDARNYAAAGFPPLDPDHGMQLLTAYSAAVDHALLDPETETEAVENLAVEEVA